MVNVESRASRGKSCTNVPVALRVTECMCTVKLFGHCIDTGTNTKYWKVQQLTDSGYQDLQHHLLIPDRFLKSISDPIRTATARTCQQDCHYCSVLQLSVATIVIMLSAHLKLIFMANISFQCLNCTIHSQHCALKQFSTVSKTLSQLITS